MQLFEERYIECQNENGELVLELRGASIVEASPELEKKVKQYGLAGCDSTLNVGNNRIIFKYSEVQHG